VTTSIGARGLDDGSAGAMVVADEPASFARAAAELLVDASARRELERRALAFADTLPTWDDAAASLRGCYGALARERTLVEAEGAELR
jgi:hypothetical protein